MRVSPHGQVRICRCSAHLALQHVLPGDSRLQQTLKRTVPADTASICIDKQWCELTRHDCALREVAGEEVVIHGDVFVADGVLLQLALHDAVH